MKILKKISTTIFYKFKFNAFSGCHTSCGCGSNTSKSNHFDLNQMNEEIGKTIEEGKYIEGLEKIDNYLINVSKEFGELSEPYTSGLYDKAFMLSQVNKKFEAIDILKTILKKYDHLKGTEEFILENEVLVKFNLISLLRELNMNQECTTEFEELLKVTDNESELRPETIVQIYLSASSFYLSSNQQTKVPNILDKTENFILKNSDNEEFKLHLAFVYDYRAAILKTKNNYNEALEFLYKSIEIKKNYLGSDHEMVISTEQVISQVISYLENNKISKELEESTKI